MKIKKGDILIARPSSGDHIFSRSVVLITEYNEYGTVGFILNRPSHTVLDAYVSGLDFDSVVYEGGPVEVDNIYYLHKRPDLITNSEHIKDDLYWSGNYEDLKEALLSKKIKESELRFYLGYAGWAEKQLEGEFDRNAWTLIEEKVDIFNDWDENLWKEQMNRLGGENLLWVNAPSDPNLN